MLGFQSLRSFRCALAATLTLSACLAVAPSAKAQITPDQSLGAESSVVTPDVEVRGAIADQINGGAARGQNLFHSFQDFNVLTNQRVYFANPASIENIISRVTGGNLSNIDGLLGVDGAANLFFLNPNGIVFGPHAQLDVSGSFVAGTGTGFTFLDGSEFSATNPNAAPLVTVNLTPGIQFGPDAPAALTSQANLAAGQDLRLAAGVVTSSGNLTAGGQVSVEGVSGNVQVQDVTADSALLSAQGDLILAENQLQTTNDLTLQATGTVSIRDSEQNAFSADAGGNLTIRGEEAINILALNHPETPFRSGGDLTLISDGLISGDAHYESGGNFSILNTTGGGGDFLSFYDPIILATGNVSFGTYSGVSLKIEAGGSISATGNITITGPETAAAVAGDPDAATLTASAALILRSGQASVVTDTDLTTVDNPPDSDFTPDEPTASAASGADIDIGGNIDAGDGAAGEIILVTNGGSINLNGSSVTANGGDITLEGTVNFNNGVVTGNVTGGTGADAYNFNGGTLTGSLNGAGGSDTLTGGNVANTFTVTGANSGTATGITGGFSNIENLVGNAQADSFTLNGGTLSGSVNGAGGSDTLTGDNVANTFSVTGANSGTATGITGGFSNIENLVGNAQADDFTLNGGTLSGSVDGAGGSDTLTGDNVANTFSVTGANSGTATGITGGFSNIENLVGNAQVDSFTLNGGTLSGSVNGAGGSDTLTGGNVANTFTVTGANSGTATGITGGFSNIENLVGNAQADSFTLNGGTLSGSVNGAGGSDTLTGDNVANSFSITGANSGTATGTGGFSNIENLVGNAQADDFTLNGGTLSGSVNGAGGSDTLTGDNVANTFTVTGANSGTATGVTGGFSNLENLVGNAQADIFNLNAGSITSLSGAAGNDTFNANGGTATTANGGDDNDTFNLNADGISNLNGNDGDDRFVVADGVTLSGTINGGTGTSDELDFSAFSSDPNVNLANLGNGIEIVQGSTQLGVSSTLNGQNNANTWTIDGSDSGTVDTTAFFNFTNLVGGTAVDTFNLSAGGSVTSIGGGNGADIFNADGGTVTTASGGVGADTFNINTSGIGTANGDDGNDTFNFNVLTATDVDGGAGTNTLNGTASSDRFQITGTNAGSLNFFFLFDIPIADFSNIQNLNGLAGDDNFSFDANIATNAIAIDGGADSDRLDFSSYTIDPDVNLANIGADNIEEIQGSTQLGVSSTLSGQNNANTWTIDGTDSGTVDTTAFFNFTNLVGGTAVDTFNLSAGGSVTSIDSGNGADIFNVTGGTATTLNSGNGGDVFTLTSGSLGTVNGGDGNDEFNVNGASLFVDTLNGDVGNDVFNLTSGSVSNLNGGDGNNDQFVFFDDGFTSNIDGGNGNNDTLDYSNIVDPVVDLSAFDVQNIEAIIGSNASNSTLIGADVDNIWSITGINSGTLNSSLDFSDFQNFVGGNLTDTFIWSGIGAITGNIDGGTGTLTLESDNAINLTGTSISGTGSLIIQQSTAGTGIQFDGAGSGLNLTPSLFSSVIADGFTDIAIGNTETGDVVTSNNFLSFNAPVTLQGSSVTTNGFISNSGNDVTLIGNGGAVVLNSGINTATGGSDGGNVSLTGTSVTLNNGVTIDPFTGGNSASTGKTGDITITALTGDVTLGSGILYGDNYNLGGGGNISIVSEQGSINLNGGRRIISTNGGQGTGGSVSLQAAQAVNIQGLGAAIDTSTNGTGTGGNIAIAAETINVQNQAALNAETTGSAIGGNIALVATQAITIQGGATEISTNASGSGNGGSLTAQAPDINLQNGAIISAQTSGGGTGGSIGLTATQTLNIQGGGTGVITDASSSGLGGTITAQATDINVQDGAVVSAQASAASEGGNVIFQAGQNLILQGTTTEVTTRTTGTGAGGDVAFTAGNQLEIDGSKITADATNSGAGGTISLQGGTVRLQNNAEVQARTASSGAAGNVVATAVGQLDINDSVITTDTSSTGAGGSVTAQGSAINLNNAIISTGTSGAGTGPGGDIGINAATDFNLTDSTISSSTLSSQLAIAGNITIAAANISLDNGRIIAETSDNETAGGGFVTSGGLVGFNVEGGNITVSGTGIGSLLMANNSLISARGIEVGATQPGVGSSNSAVAGGNIFFSNFLTIRAVDPPIGPAGNDIVTNESLAGGGVIDFGLILPDGFVLDELGLSFAELRSNSQNDLSTNGLIDILDTGIFEQAAAIPLAFVDLSELVGDSCSAGTSENSEFIVGGQGGLPTSPNQPLSPTLDNNDWILIDDSFDSSASTAPPAASLARQQQPGNGICLNSLLSQTIQ